MTNPAKSKRPVYRLAQRVKYYVLKLALSKRPTEPEAAKPETTWGDLIQESQSDSPITQEERFTACSAVPAGQISGKQGTSEVDSGYGSAASTPSSQPPAVFEPTLKSFYKNIPLQVQNRFNDFRILHSPTLIDSVLSDGKAKNISMKLKYLGETEHTAQLHIVVQCDRDIVKKVEQFFAQEHVLEDLGSEFRVEIRGGTLLSLSGTIALDVLGGWGSRQTLCGMPILVRNEGANRRATFGGLIAVTLSKKQTILYGVTAAHPAAALVSNPVSNDTGDSNNLVDEETGHSHTLLPITQQITEWDTLVPESDTLGTITIPGLLKGRDWALIELTCRGLLPNQIFTSERLLDRISSRLPTAGMKLEGTDLFASPHPKSYFHARPAAVLTSRGLQHGQISSNRSALTTSLAIELVEVYDFCPLGGTELLPGDSGSWVVDPRTGEVYGHVISTDAFGEANVIPIQLSLEAVREQLGAQEARLPTATQISQFLGKRDVLASVSPVASPQGGASSTISDERVGRPDGKTPRVSGVKRLIKRATAVLSRFRIARISDSSDSSVKPVPYTPAQTPVFAQAQTQFDPQRHSQYGPSSAITPSPHNSVRPGLFYSTIQASPSPQSYDSGYVSQRSSPAGSPECQETIPRQHYQQTGAQHYYYPGSAMYGPSNWTSRDVSSR